MNNTAKEIEELRREKESLSCKLSALDSALDAQAYNRSMSKSDIEELIKESDEIEKRISEINEKIKELQKNNISKR